MELADGRNVPGPYEDLANALKKAEASYKATVLSAKTRYQKAAKVACERFDKEIKGA